MKQIAKRVLKQVGVLGATRATVVAVRMHSERRRELDLYRQFIRKGDLCIDVGANIGDKTDLFLRLGASVIAIEPQTLLTPRRSEDQARDLWTSINCCQ